MPTRHSGRIALLVAVVMWALCCPVSPARAADAEDAHYNAVVSLYNMGQWQAAISKIEEREKLDISEAMRSKYLYAKGLALEKGAKTGDARSAYAQLITKYPKAAEVNAAQVSLLYLDYSKGDAEAVAAGYPKIDQAKLSPADKKNLALMYAECLYSGKKDDKAALAAYKAAIAQGADAKAVAAKLFDLNLRLGNSADLVAQSAQGVPGVPPETLALARAEALVALGRFAEADTESQKVPATSDLFPRASFARAQALIKQNKLKDAAAPLKAAIAGLKDPPAPPAAFVALAECLAENGQADEVPKALDQAEHAIRDLPAADKDRFKSQIALLRLRSAANGDRKKLIEAVGEARESVPKEQLPKILYMRLFALSEEGERKGVLRTMKDDYPIFQTGPEDGPATLIYYNALKQSDQGEDATKLLEDFLKRKPQAPEAAKARLQLAAAALAKGDNAQARTHYDALAANAQAPAQLGKNPFDEAMFNRAIVIQKLGDQPAAAKALAALVAAKPSADLLHKALPLLGQAYAVQKDYANAAAAWKQALAAGKADNELDLRDRLARVEMAAGDNAGAAEQCAAAATLAGGDAKLSRELREVWARSLFAAGKFADSAAKYQGLAESYSDAPTYAYECAIALERAGRRDESIKWYSAAQEHKDKLPADYASAVDARLAAARIEGGSAEQSLPYWLDQIANAKDGPAFEGAVTAVRRIAADHALDAKSRERLAAALAAVGPDQPRHYTVGALLLQMMLGAQKNREAGELGDRLATDFAANEKKLDPKASGATVAPAMIFFYKGEVLRQTEHYSDALAAYETVLTVYPYNEWPDAATCGEAECYAALGDRDGAVKKFKEVVAAASPSPASAKWRELAGKRIAELSQAAPAAPGAGNSAAAKKN